MQGSRFLARSRLSPHWFVVALRLPRLHENLDESWSLSSRLLVQETEPESLYPTLLPTDSQRHRVTEEEAQQNRFQMPPLEEGESRGGGA